MKRIIHWFRRDLRIADNHSLSQAAKDGEVVIPVYVLSEWKKSHRWTGYARQSFLCGCLESLARNLETIGGRLIIRSGDAVEELRKTIKSTQADALYTNRDPDPFGQEQEKQLEKICAELGCRFRTFKDVSLHESGEVLTGDERPYRVYTPYKRAWYKHEKPGPMAKPKSLNTPDSPKGLDLPTVAHWQLSRPDDFEGHVEPGEKAARQRLKEAIAGIIPSYDENRNTPAGQTTSRLSQDLRWGTLSIRTVYAECQKALDASSSASERKGLCTYMDELAWRDFYLALLNHYPEVLETSFNPSFSELPWEEGQGEAFERWVTGRTGFPIVDAGMRELNRTGFMHNRLRMIVAMFLTKDLRIHWRAGESAFMQRLVDGEIASNNGGWQWSAGTGADAAPYFRIQNPWTQSERYDPQGAYIRENVPELAKVPAKALHQPPADGLPVADDYPAPMVDHKAEREKTLDWFKKHRAAA